MSLDISNTDKLAVFYQDAKRFGVKIRPPCVNRSSADFEVEANPETQELEVLYALGGIRNVGLQAMEHVVQVRSEGGPFRDPAADAACFEAVLGAVAGSDVEVVESELDINAAQFAVAAADRLHELIQKA